MNRGEFTTYNNETAAQTDTGTASYTGIWKVNSFCVNAGMVMVNGENAKAIGTLNSRDQKASDVGEITSWGPKFNGPD